jgi:molybdate transport system substrate-binding protein
MTTRLRSVIVLIAAAAAGLALAGPTGATEIKVLAGSAVQPVMLDLTPKFEQASGHKVTFDYGTVGGMAERVRKGEAADVAIVSGSQAEFLEKEGKIVAGSRRDFAKVGVGVFVRKGVPKPDIGSVEAFRRTVLAAKSIGYNDPAAGAPVSLYLVGAFERLGIAAEMTPKTVAFKQRSERFEAVARGDVELGFNQISEIVAAPGVDLVGPLPAEIQNYTVLSAGVVVASQQRDAAMALIEFISSAAAMDIMTSRGFERP